MDPATAGAGRKLQPDHQPGCADHGEVPVLPNPIKTACNFLAAIPNGWDNGIATSPAIPTTGPSTPPPPAGPYGWEPTQYARAIDPCGPADTTAGAGHHGRRGSSRNKAAAAVTVSPTGTETSPAAPDGRALQRQRAPFGHRQHRDDHRQRQRHDLHRLQAQRQRSGNQIIASAMTVSSTDRGHRRSVRQVEADLHPVALGVVDRRQVSGASTMRAIVHHRPPGRAIPSGSPCVLDRR